MATLYAAADGTLLALDIPGAGPPIVAPPGTTQSLAFDEATNQAVVTALQTDSWSRFRLNGGILTRDGQPAPINPDGAVAKDAKQLAAIKALLDADTALSAAQLRAVLRFILRRIT